MAISWDYMAGVKGTQAGQKAAAQSNLATRQNYASNISNIKAQQRQLEQEKIAAEAQEAAIEQSDALTYQTFNDGSQKDSFAGLNAVFDKTNQDLISTYNSIKNNKDMDSADQARLMRTMLNQVPLLKQGKQFLDTQMKLFSTGSQTGEISNSMEPKFQRVYSELLNGKFDGGIVFEGDELILKGITSQGEPINKKLREFSLNMPKVVDKAASLTDSTDGYMTELEADIAGYQKTGKNSSGDLKIPQPPGKAQRKAIETRIDKMANDNEGGDPLYMYGMDTLNIPRDVIDARVDALTGTVEKVDMIAKDIDIDNLKIVNSQGEEYDSPFGNTNLQAKSEPMTKADAKLKVLDEMIDQEMAVLTSVYNKSMKVAPQPPKSGLTLVDKTYASIIKEGTQGMTLDQNNIMSSDNLLGATAQDFNVAKGTGFDNTATNLQEGFNENGDYIVSFDQIAKYEGEPALTTTYNLSTEAGAKDFLLARFENEQGRRASNAKDTKESKEDAMKLAPLYAKSFRDYKKALKKQQAERLKFEEEQERMNTLILGPDYKSNPGFSEKEFTASRPEIFEGITIE
jgi:hypothetical protein